MKLIFRLLVVGSLAWLIFGTVVPMLLCASSTALVYLGYLLAVLTALGVFALLVRTVINAVQILNSRAEISRLRRDL